MLVRTLAGSDAGVWIESELWRDQLRGARSLDWALVGTDAGRGLGLNSGEFSYGVLGLGLGFRWLV